MRLTVLRSGPPSEPLSTSTPGPIARHACVDHRAARLRDGNRRHLLRLRAHLPRIGVANLQPSCVINREDVSVSMSG